MSAPLAVFNNVSVDGYFTGPGGDLSWAHASAPDPEFDAFVNENASGGGRLLLGRKTYEMMAAWWPTDAARRAAPEVADGMNRMTKIVFSRTMDRAEWSHTQVVSGLAHWPPCDSQPVRLPERTLAQVPEQPIRVT